ncbi:MAG: CRISPR-associated endonuclease Cas2 [Planctomycetaceae bacterium]
MRISGYRAMWLLVLFDLPVKTKPERKLASEFRKNLIQDGFWMLQFSVYARPCASEENLDVHCARVKLALPPDGEVRVMAMTDRQYGRMKVFLGKKRTRNEAMPAQLEFF